MKIGRVDRQNGNTPVLSKGEIEEFACEVLADYKPNLLKEPGAVGFEHFIERYLGLPLFFRHIYYDNPKSPIFGATVFGGAAVKVFDREDERIKTEIFREECVIIDNYVMESGREGMANFTGVHEGAHYLMHSGITFPEKTRRIFCRRESLDGSAGGAQGPASGWVEYQANCFAAAFAMPISTFVPLVNDFLRGNNVWKRCIDIGEDEELDIVAKNLLPEYVSEVYGVSMRAACNRLKTTGFVRA